MECAIHFVAQHLIWESWQFSYVTAFSKDCRGIVVFFLTRSLNCLKDQTKTKSFHFTLVSSLAHFLFFRELSHYVEYFLNRQQNRVNWYFSKIKQKDHKPNFQLSRTTSVNHVRNILNWKTIQEAFCFESRGWRKKRRPLKKEN